MSAPLLLVINLLLSANPYLDRGRALYESVHYPEAEQQLKIARSVPTSTREERRETFDLLARCASALGRPAEAERWYEELLREDPETPDPEHASPKIRELFTRAKQRVFPPDFVAVKELPSDGRTLILELADPWKQVDSVVLMEAAESGSWTPRPLLRTGARASTALPRAASGPVRWYVEVRDATGRVLAGLGSAVQPRVVETSQAVQVVSADGRSPPAKQRGRWPAWTAAGVGAVAAITGVALMLAADGDYRSAQSAFYGSETRTLHTRYEQRTRASWIAFGVAATGAVTASFLWVF